MTDLQFTNHGSIILLESNTVAGQDWIDANIEVDASMIWGDAIAIEARYAWGICQGALADGLTCE